MTIQLDVTTRNARLDAIESSIGVSPTMQIRSGAPPGSTSGADSGTLLANLALPADWLAAAGSGAKAMSGSWADNSADGTGAAGHFRVKDSGGTVRMQGTVTITGGGGDMEVDNTSFAAGQAFTVTAFQLNEPNS
jgi:hypothetical protein